MATKDEVSNGLVNGLGRWMWVGDAEARFDLLVPAEVVFVDLGADLECELEQWESHCFQIEVDVCMSMDQHRTST